MALDLAGQTVTGGAQFGLTSPTHTWVADRPVDNRSSQFAATVLGGTQTNARAHKISDPFTLTVKAPATIKPRPVISVDGLIVGTVAMMEFRLLMRKGVYVYGTNIRNMYIDLRVGVPAGADAVDGVNVRTAMSAFWGIGATYGQSLGNDIINGTF